jgi:hypothetical protein
MHTTLVADRGTDCDVFFGWWRRYNKVKDSKATNHF